MYIFSFVFLTSYKIANPYSRKMINSGSHKITKPSFHKITKSSSHKIAKTKSNPSSDKMVKSISFNIFFRDP